MTLVFRFRRQILIIVFLMAAVGAAVGVAAQTDETSWSEPVNLSFSGAAVKPQMISDVDGLVHLFWQDTFDGFVYSRFDGQEWGVPQVVELPFGTRFYEEAPEAAEPTPIYTPLLAAGRGGELFAFWTDGEKGLFFSQAEADQVESFGAWSERQQLAESALSLDVFVDPAGTIHLSYVRPLESVQFPAGVYYRRSLDGGFNWSSPLLLYQSPYFRTLSSDNSRVKIVTDDSNRVVVAWDNRLQARISTVRSPDNGATWEAVAEVDRRLAEDGLEASPPGQIALLANGSELHRFWQAGHEGLDCVQYHELSTDGGATWQPRQAMVPGALSTINSGDQITGCPKGNYFVGEGEGSLLAFSVFEEAVYALSWQDGVWSLPEGQGDLASFQDPETFYPVTLGCHQFSRNGERLLVVGCDVDDNGGKDIWAIEGDLSSLEAGLAPPEAPVWQEPVAVATDLEQMSDLSLVADQDGRLHAFWSQTGADGSAIYYAGWDGSRWSRPGPVLASEVDDRAEQVAVVLDGRGRLLAVWNGPAGEISFSQVETNRAGVASDWAEVVTLPEPRPAASGPAIALDRAGTIFVAYSIQLNEARGIYLVQSGDDGQSWSEPVQVYDGAAAGWEMVGWPELTVDGVGRLHLIWGQVAPSGDSRAISLYYARSEDGGANWSEPSAVIEKPSTGGQLLAVGERSLHLLWQESDSRLWHRFSHDGGLTWSQPARVAGLGEVVGPAAVTLDGAGQLQALQVSSAGDGSAELLEIRHWSWQDDRWLAGEGVSLGNGDVGEVDLLAAAVSPVGELGVLFVGPSGGSRGLYFSSRQLELPAVVPTPLPTLTPTPRPVETATPIPPPQPTPTVFFPTNADSGSGLNLPFGSNDTLSGTLAGILPAGLIVLVAFFVGFRLLRGNRRGR